MNTHFNRTPGWQKIRIHKSSFEKIKITIKSQENISPPLPKTALVDLQYTRSAYTWCEWSVTSRTITPDLNEHFKPVFQQGRVWTLEPILDTNSSQQKWIWRFWVQNLRSSLYSKSPAPGNVKKKKKKKKKNRDTHKTKTVVFSWRSRGLIQIHL